MMNSTGSYADPRQRIPETTAPRLCLPKEMEILEKEVEDLLTRMESLAGRLAYLASPNGDGAARNLTGVSGPLTAHQPGESPAVEAVTRLRNRISQIKSVISRLD